MNLVSPADPRDRPSLAPREQAEWEQRRASDPAVSAFVAASAGSGKTKLLTDRLLRLMLGSPDRPGAPPARIQCLTFTKAAAAEMALRLQARLGRWVTLDGAALDAELAALQVPEIAEMRQRARALFAEVLDLPGGMRIGTIHAFCQSLLRRFPLEAALSPHFRLLEETDAGFALDAAREHVLGEPDADLLEALDTAATLLPAQGFFRLLARLEAAHGRLAPLLALPKPARDLAIARAAGLRVAHEDALTAAAIRADDPALLQAIRLIAAQGAPRTREKAEAMLDWLGLDDALRAEHWEQWPPHFLRADGAPRELGGIANKRLLDAHPELRDPLLGEQNRLIDIEDQRNTLRMVAATRALLDLAAPMLADFSRRKQGGGLLGYDDLIGHTLALLKEPGAAWVLYKLDGGLDHLLLDEVQDTSDAQWRIADALTAEFFAGSGAREQSRSFFAVGDPKQSIYSFQGADPDAFIHWRRTIGDRVRQSGETWRDVPLDVSFRSTAPVLALVDAVFANPTAAGGVVLPGEVLQHGAVRAGQAGQVELWPLVPTDAAAPPEPWAVPTANRTRRSAPQRLAEALADWIARQTDGSVMLESKGRPLAAGDVLVLVRRRQAFSRALVRALKSRGVAIAGLDRMVLTEEPAVQDLLALCDVLLLPQDDLSLASVLTSPLGGLDDASLMALAVGRPGRLWDALRRRAGERDEWRRAADFIAALLARVDYATPHTILVEALGSLGGRARLFARLGPEAAEPVDELLGLALAYGTAHPPALQGFLHWVRRAASEIKREPEGAGGAVRVMTVHGAKGLQAPLVILPDTTALPRPDDSRLAWAQDDITRAAVPLWSPRKELHCTVCTSLIEEANKRQTEEYNRLLYVALTRAEDRLLICGWVPRSEAALETSWYGLVRKGFDALGAEAEDFDPVRTGVPNAWEGTLRRHSAAQTVALPAQAMTATQAGRQAAPHWAGQAPLWQPDAPPAEPPLPRSLAPSRPEGVELGTIPRVTSPADPTQRFRRGMLMHALLQHLPDLPPDRREAAAALWLRRPGNGLTEAAQAVLVRETLGVLDHPALAPLFGPDSRAELALSGVVGGQVVTGKVDRIAILPDRILLADFKTNRDPPDRPEDTPPLYLRQLAAYRAILRLVYPDRRIDCFLIWTQGARVSPLSDALLDPHAPGSAA